MMVVFFPPISAATGTPNPVDGSDLICPLQSVQDLGALRVQERRPSP